MHSSKSLLAVVSLWGGFTAVSAQYPTVSSSFYSQMQKYTGFSAAAYGDSCQKPPSGSTVVQYFNVAQTDTQATLFRLDSSREFILSYRGTSTPQDYQTDFGNFLLTPLTVTGTNCAACQVHTNFQIAANSIQPQLLSAVRSQLASRPGYTLTVTGHSLGGALASLGAASFAASGMKPTVWTFGEPRNGNPAFQTYIQGLIPRSQYYRVTHANDGVPQLPPAFIGYTHHGTEYWESTQSGVAGGNTFNCSAGGPDPGNCNAGQSSGGNPINLAHISYTNSLIGNALHISACGATPAVIPK